MSIAYRHGTPADEDAVFEVLVESLSDLNRRESGPDSPRANPSNIRDYWTKSRPGLDFVVRTAERFWVAEHDGRVVGYARTIVHDGVRELTKFMVLPAYQSAGVGRELLGRAFPAEGARRRTILASHDEKAHARYLKSGVYPRFWYGYFFRAPEPVPIESDLRFEPVTATETTLAAFGAIDQQLLDSRRDAIHEFLLSTRPGYAYRRGEKVVGYGYLGKMTGPFALLDAADFPAVLAHAETDAAGRGIESFGLNVPMINRAAVTYLLARNFRFNRGCDCMSDEPFGKFEQYLICRPPLFI